MLFWLERARHSHILQVYPHLTSIHTPYKYTDTLQVYIYIYIYIYMYIYDFVTEAGPIEMDSAI